MHVKANISECLNWSHEILRFWLHCNDSLHPAGQNGLRRALLHQKAQSNYIKNEWESAHCCTTDSWGSKGRMPSHFAAYPFLHSSTAGVVKLEEGCQVELSRRMHCRQYHWKRRWCKPCEDLLRFPWPRQSCEQENLVAAMPERSHHQHQVLMLRMMMMMMMIHRFTHGLRH